MSNRSWKHIRRVLAAALVTAAAAMAQDAPDRAVRPEEAKAGSQEEPGAQARPLDRRQVLPAAEPSPAATLAAMDKVYVRKIVVEGKLVPPKDDLARITRPYEGREVTVDELSALRREISQTYVQRGYINSGVIVPDQEVVNGTIVLKEVQGNLAKIEVTGNGHLSRNYILGRVKAAADEPLRIDRLQAALELLQQDPLIQRVNARLVPGLQPGQADLQVAVKRTHPFEVEAGADNQSSASTGGERGRVLFTHLNVTGHGDSVSADVGVSGGSGVGSIAYSIPLNARNTRIQAEYALDDARIIEEPFDEIDIRSRTQRGGLFLSHPWIRTPRRSLVTAIGLVRKHSESTLLGVPFSFSLGDRDGKSDTTVISAGVEFTARGRNQVLAVRANLRCGVDLFKATINEDAPDGRFTAFLGQAEYGRRLGPFGSELLLRGTGQFAPDPLLALEKMPIGGFETVRGYRENQFVRDNGVAGSLEWRVPVRRAGPEQGRFHPLNLQVAPFADAGRSWDVDTALSESAAETIASAGIGLLWNPVAGLRADIYWGHAFKEVTNPHKDLQDKGFHFLVRFGTAF